MATLMRAALAEAAPLAIVSIDTMLIVAAALAGGGAVIIGLISLRARRRRATPHEPAVRRAPSPTSVGLADDPIVAAMGLGAGEARKPRRVRTLDDER